MSQSTTIVILAVALGCAVVIYEINREPIPNESVNLEKYVLDIADQYRNYGRVDQPVKWGIEDCRIPEPSKARFSESDDDDSHGQKLYYLFAKNGKAYRYSNEFDQPVGQVVVKETWKPAEYSEKKPDKFNFEDIVIEESDNEGDEPGDKSTYFPFAEKDDQWYHASELDGLFIMAKLAAPDEATEYQTDAGWIYATVSKDLKKVTAIGLINNCMECHQSAERDRMFGLPSEEE